jgi:cell pole-organizing protein PopZ
MRKLHSLLMAAAILAVAVPSAALADDGPSASNGIGANLAIILCKQEASSVGKDAFVTKYGSPETFGNCIKQKLPAVQAAVDACKASGGVADVRACVATKRNLPAEPEHGDQKKGQRRHPEAAVWVAGYLCKQEASSLGKDAFVTKYGSPETFGNCIKQQLPAVQAVVDACKESAGGGSADVRACVAAKLSLPAPEHGDQKKGQGRPHVAVVWVAGYLCKQEASSLGKDAFVTKYGSPETFGNCIKQKLPAVQAAVDACKASAGGGFADCVRAKLGLSARGDQTPQPGGDQDPTTE